MDWLKRLMAISVLFATAILSVPRAHAAVFDVGALYLSDAFKTTDKDNRTDLLYDASILINLDRKGYYAVGWSYLGISIASKTTETTTFSTSDMGPKFLWFMDRHKHWSFGFAYNLVVSGSYKTTSNVTWKGSSYKLDFGYLGNITENVSLGGKLNYYSGAFNQQFENGSDFSKISYNRAMIYPTLNFVYMF